MVREPDEASLPTHPAEITPYCKGYDQVFLSLNRYERKKNISLAIAALKHFKGLKGTSSGVKATGNNIATQKVLLVIAGGYDLRVTENVEYLEVAQINFMCCFKSLQKYYKWIFYHVWLIYLILFTHIFFIVFTTTDVYFILCVSSQELKRHCEEFGLKYKFLADATQQHAQEYALANEGVEVVFRISIPSCERTALLMQSTGKQ